MTTDEPMTLTERLQKWADFYRTDQNGELAADLLEAAEVLGKLPVTADGVPATVGDQVWHASNLGRSYPVECTDGEWEVYVNLDGRWNKWHGVQVRQCYSSESAALAAAERKQDE